MDTLTRQAPRQTARGRPRRSWLIALIAVLITAGIAVGAWAIIEANQTDDLAIATEFADTWSEAWTTQDGESVAELFTEGGIYKESAYRSYEGRDAISRRVSDAGNFYEYGHGQVTEVEDGVFSFPVRALWRSDSYGTVGEIRVTLEGDLVSYAEVVEWRYE